MIQKFIGIALLSALLTSPVAIAQIQRESPAQEAASAVQAVMPSATINKVAVAGNYALVGWTAGNTGSSATLHKSEQGWVVVTDSMRGWPPVEIYARENGMEIEEAEALFDAFNPEWRKW